MGRAGLRKAYYLGAAVSVLAIGLVLWLSDPRQALALMAKLRWHHLLPPIIATLAGFALRAWRWQGIFPYELKPSYGRALNAMSIGLMANNILPMHGGEFLRCGLVQRGVTVAGSGVALSTVGIERILDGLVLAGVLLASLTLISPPAWLWRLALASGLLFVGALVLLISLYRFEKPLLRGVQRVFDRLAPRFTQPALEMTRRIHGVLASVASGRLLLWLALLSVGMRICEAITIWGLALSLGITLGWGQIFLVQSVLGLGLIVPAAPGYIGTYEALVVATLEVFSLGSDAALALALLMHAWLLLSTTSLGVVALGLEGIGLSQLGRVARAVETGDSCKN